MPRIQRAERCCAVLFLIIALLLVLVQQSGYLITYSIRALSFGNFTSYKVYETVRYDLIRVLQTLEFGILIVSVYRNRKGIKVKEACAFWCHCCGSGQSKYHSCTKKKTVAVAIFIINLLLALVLTVLGCARIFYINKDNMLKVILAVMIQAFKFFNLSTECIMWLFVTALILIYVSEWDTHHIKKLPISDSPCYNTLVYFQNYYRKGHDTEPTRKALQGWFVLQYVVYLLYIYTDIIHIVKPFFNGSGQHVDLVSIIHHAIFIAYDLAGFVLPYLLALWMIEAHRKYHAEMTRKHLFIEDILSKNIVKWKDEMAESEDTVPDVKSGEVIEEIKGAYTVGVATVGKEVAETHDRVKEIKPKEVAQTLLKPTEENVTPEGVKEAQESRLGLRKKGTAVPLEEILTEEMEDYIAKVVTMKIEVCAEFDFSP